MPTYRDGALLVGVVQVHSDPRGRRGTLCEYGVCVCEGERERGVRGKGGGRRSALLLWCVWYVSSSVTPHPPTWLILLEEEPPGLAELEEGGAAVVEGGGVHLCC